MFFSLCFGISCTLWLVLPFSVESFDVSLTFLRSVLMSKPEMTAVPLVAVMSPVSMLNVVVFPAPGAMNQAQKHTVNCPQHNDSI